MAAKGSTPPIKLDHERLVLTVPEAAAALGLSVRSTYTLCKSVGFPTVHLTQNRIGVSRTGLEQWIANQVNVSENI